MSAPNVRQEMQPVTRAASPVRAYFAPVNRVTGAPTIFDPAQQGAFDLDAPPAPWIDLGAVIEFTRSAATKVTPLRSGPKGSVLVQSRAQMDARISFRFREWGKLQMALSSGAQHMNVLAETSGATASASGGAAAAAVAVQSGPSASQIIVGASNVSKFSVGDLIAVDVDYAGQTGYVGSGIAGAYVKNAADVGNNVDYIRRVTFNLARVSSTDATSLWLAQPLLGGAPPANSKVQKVIAFLDREGASFFQEWSALFVVPEETGGRACFHYPRLQTAAPIAEQESALAKGLNEVGLRAEFVALPVSDPNDAEQVVCYRSYFPPISSDVY